MSHSSLFRKNIDSAIAAVAGFFIIFLFTRHGGIGLCPDGVVYTTTAENLHSTGHLRDFTNHPMINFPALYPSLLTGIIFLTGIKPLLFEPYVNGLLFGVVIFMSGYIMEYFSFPSKWYKRAILTCIVFSPALLEVYSMVWSETVFIVLLLLFMVSMYRYFNSYSSTALITSVIIAALASITRYAGVTVIAAGIVFILLDMKMPRKQKIKNLLLYTFISPLLLIINLLRNYFLSGTKTGIREKAFSTFEKNTFDAGSVFHDWLPFLQGHYAGAVVTFFLIIIILFAISIKYFLSNRRLSSYESMAAVFSLLYILFIVVVASLSRFESLNSRFFSPVFILLLWSCSSWIPGLTHRIRSSKKKMIIGLGALIFLSFMYGQLNADYETWDGVKDAGIPGYTEDQWRYSPTVQFMQRDTMLFRKGYTVYSNAYDAVYFFTGRPGKFLPHKEYKPGIKNFLNDQHCYMIWFTDGEDSDLVGMPFITLVKKMTLMKKFDDGWIYQYDK